MELRSRIKERDKEEYEELKICLSGMGLFEEQMDLREMQDILQAVQMSEACFLEKENVSQQSFVHPNQNMHNSTMIDSRRKRKFSSPESSPESHSESHVVKAIVHHPMDWSPFREIDFVNNISERRNSMRKRYTNIIHNEKSHEAAKRLRYDSIENVDSGVNLTNSTSQNLSPQKSDLTKTSKLNDAVNAVSATIPPTAADNSEIELYESYSKMQLENPCSTEHKELNNNYNMEVISSTKESTISVNQPEIGGYYDPTECWD